MTHQLTPSLQLTTEHCQSRYGFGVLLHQNRDAYGPVDMLEYGGQLWPAAKHVVRFAKHHPDNAALQAAATAFCSQWPEGPQIETEIEA
jgi:hypothetical protein